MNRYELIAELQRRRVVEDAWINGGEIEMKCESSAPWVRINGITAFIWQEYDYRVKPEPRKPQRNLVPWQPESKLIGKIIRHKTPDQWASMITRISSNRIAGADFYESPQDLLAHYEQIDGSPCGYWEVIE